VTVPPSGFVTTTSTAPALPGGVTTVTRDEVRETTVAAFAPKSTVTPCWKLEPFTLTVVPPAISPALGETLEIVGAGLYVYVDGPLTADVPAEFVTRMFVDPELRAGEATLIAVSESTVNVGAFVDPKRTCVVPLNPVPVTVTVVPPVVGPLCGATPVMTGTTIGLMY
jgi:hypothetical protein